MTVASIPMLSATTRSIPIADAATPRMKFPPPTTMATCTPICLTSVTSWAIREATSGSTPNPCLPIRASPLSFTRMRLNTGRLMPSTRWQQLLSPGGAGPRALSDSVWPLTKTYRPRRHHTLPPCTSKHFSGAASRFRFAAASPTFSRENRLTLIFSPNLAILEAISSPTVCPLPPSLMKCCSYRQLSS